jgi:hypothetical protein
MFITLLFVVSYIYLPIHSLNTTLDTLNINVTKNVNS